MRLESQRFKVLVVRNAAQGTAWKKGDRHVLGKAGTAVGATGLSCTGRRGICTGLERTMHPREWPLKVGRLHQREGKESWTHSDGGDEAGQWATGCEATRDHLTVGDVGNRRLARLGVLSYPQSDLGQLE